MYGWFIVQSFTACESRVKRDIERRAMDDGIRGIRQVVIPTELISEVNGGQKVTVEKRTMPGYVLIEMESTVATRRMICETKGVVGFVGADPNDPTPLPAAEADRILRSRTHGEKDMRPSLDVSVGQSIGVAHGPFKGLTGEVAEINEDGAKLKLMVPIFGQKTPVEISFDQVKLESST